MKLKNKYYVFSCGIGCKKICDVHDRESSIEGVRSSVNFGK